MSNEIMQSSQYGLWVAEQASKGTPAETADLKLRAISGGFRPTPEYSRENYGDGNRFSGASDFVDTLVGIGDPTVQGQAHVVSRLLYYILGAAAYTAAVPAEGEDPAVPSKQVITPSEDGGKWLTFYHQVGEGDVSVMERYADCRVRSLTLEASSATKTMHVSMDVMSLDPAEVTGAAPAKTLSDIEPLLFTDAVGALTVDGVAIAEINQVRLIINDNLEPYYGDNFRPLDFVPGRSTIEVSWSAIVTEATLKYYNLVHYGKEEVVVGDKPTGKVFKGAVNFTWTRDNESINIVLPEVMYAPDLVIVGMPDGGAVDLAMDAEARPPAAAPIITVTTTSDSPDHNMAY